MGFADFYFSRFLHHKSEIAEYPVNDLHYIIVIPCYNEPDVISVVQNLWECDRPETAVEIIVVINSKESDNKQVKIQNDHTEKILTEWAQKHNSPGLKLLTLKKESLSDKWGGAGLARKIGMDEALHRFNHLGRANGIIISLDADCRVASNYLTEIERHYTKCPKLNAATVFFKHPVGGKEFPASVYRGVAEYELHLRHFTNGLRFAGFPFAFYTIGSCFTVRAGIYAKQGGMNRRKAGEDFYFLHKVFPLGWCTEINTTTVYPSPRPSDRVPFGTGPVIEKAMHEPDFSLDTYHPDFFLDLQVFLDEIKNFFFARVQNSENFKRNQKTYFRDFLSGIDFYDNLQSIISQSPDMGVYFDRFFRWFNGFSVIKLINFAHAHHYSKLPVRDACEQLLKLKGVGCKGKRSAVDLLTFIRKTDRDNPLRIGKSSDYWTGNHSSNSMI